MAVSVETIIGIYQINNLKPYNEYELQFQILENNIGECFFNALKKIMKTEANIVFYLFQQILQQLIK